MIRITELSVSRPRHCKDVVWEGVTDGENRTALWCDESVSPDGHLSEVHKPSAHVHREAIDSAMAFQLSTSLRDSKI